MQESNSKRIRMFLIVVSTVLLIPALVAVAATTVAIQAAPSTVRIGGPQPTYFTVHAEIPFRLVADVSLAVDGTDIPIAYTKPDLCGDLVVKAYMAEVQAAVAPGSATVSLDGVLVTGETFSGTCSVRVVRYSGGQRSR